MIVPLENNNEASDCRLFQHISEGDLVACISAFRNPIEIITSVDSLREKFPDWEFLIDANSALSPNDRIRKLELLHQVLHINRKRNVQIESYIRTLHWGFNKVEGHLAGDNGSDFVEETFLIIAPASQEKELTTFLISANRAYSQDAALLVVNGCAYLVSKTEKSKDPIGTISLCATELGRQYSKIKGKTFRFGAVLESCEIKERSSNWIDFLVYRTNLRWLNERREDYCKMP